MKRLQAGLTTGTTVAGLTVILQLITKKVTGLDLSADQAAILSGMITGGIEFIRSRIPWLQP